MEGTYIDCEYMLGEELNRRKQLDVSKSSFLGSEADDRKLREIIEERDRTIHLLTRKIDKLEANLKKTALTKTNSDKERQARGDGHNYFEMLEVEVNKTKKLEDIITAFTRRVNAILEDLAQDNSFTDNSEEIRQMLEDLDLQNNQSFSSDYMDEEGHTSFSISQEWTKNLDLLDGTIKSFKAKCLGYKQEAKTLQLKIQENIKLIEELNAKLKDIDEVPHIKAELKEERKQREKLRGLLDRTEFEKNEIMNKINNIGFREAEIRAKTKEELLQYSKELNYRVKDLQKEKQDIIKQTNKEKETELRKYQDVLRKLRTIKETSRMGKSFA